MAGWLDLRRLRHPSFSFSSDWNSRCVSDRFEQEDEPSRREGIVFEAIGAWWKLLNCSYFSDRNAEGLLSWCRKHSYSGEEEEEEEGKEPVSGNVETARQATLFRKGLGMEEIHREVALLSSALFSTR
jgi:hypothetical protein